MKTKSSQKGLLIAAVLVLGSLMYKGAAASAPVDAANCAYTGLLK